MIVKTSHGHISVEFTEGNFAGMTVRFSGEPLPHGLSIYPFSAKIIAPIERKLTEEDIEYIKPYILKYIDSEENKRKVIWGRS